MDTLTWWQACADEVESLAAAGRDPLAALARNGQEGSLDVCDLPCISIDSATTRDVDDAFHVEAEGDGWALTLMLACPSLFWNFGGPLDKMVLHRGTSIYLPEGDCHMLPEVLGTDAYSLLAGQTRPALSVLVHVAADGTLGECEISVVQISLAANLTYVDSQAVLDAQAAGEPLPQNAATPYAEQLRLGLELARQRQTARIADGAVIMDRPDPVIRLEGEGADVRVEVGLDYQASDAQMLVAEMMILASAAVAQWAADHGVGMLHRVQDVALPREYAGIWTTPQDMTRIMRALTPSGLEVQARPHAALGLARYTPVTSPLRRYPDLVNEEQLVHFFRTGAPRWTEAELTDLLNVLSPALDAAGQVQRFRPRYWKLLFFRQKGDKVWWNGVITEENDAFITVSLPDQGMIPEQGNRPTLASGLVAVPQTAQKKLPVVSYQHGTVFTRTAVPSRPEESDETRIVTARLAGSGYVVIGADYIGKGDSTEPDSYMGNPDIATPAPIVDKLVEAAQKPVNHRYSLSRGIPNLRKAICDRYARHYGVQLDPDSEAIVTLGSKEGLAHLSLAILEPGDVVLAPDPTYPIHKYAPIIAGADVRSVPIGPGRNFFEDLEAAMRQAWPKPKVLFICYPHNPTTEVTDLEFFQKIVDFAKENHIWVVHALPVVFAYPQPLAQKALCAGLSCAAGDPGQRHQGAQPLG